LIVNTGLSVGVMSAELGVSTATLRKWEARYGFPVPMRAPGGARLYDASTVAQLRQVKTRLAAGEKPGVVLRTPSTLPQTTTPVAELPDALAALLAALNEGQLAWCEAWLADQMDRLGPAAFADDVLGPLLSAIGLGWSARQVRIFEEHKLSALFLRTLARAVPSALPSGMTDRFAARPKVLLTTLPGEQHHLGLAMAEAVLKHARAYPINLGPSMPLEEIADAAGRFQAAIVGLSLSHAQSGRLAQQQVDRLRQLLPAQVCLWLGGSGVMSLQRTPQGVKIFTCCRDIESELAQYPASRPCPSLPTWAAKSGSPASSHTADHMHPMDQGTRKCQRM